MKIAVCTITYNEDKLLQMVLKNWEGKVYKHLVLHSDKPWHGHELPRDNSEEITKSFKNTEFKRMYWQSEHLQRSWGLAYLYDYDYVLMVDSDELYEEKDQEKILSSIGVVNRFEDNQNCYRIPQLVTYFKSFDYVLDPPDRHEPVIAVNPKKVTFKDARIPSTDYQIPIEGTKIHHLTYLRDDLRLWHKLQQFEHCEAVKSNWFEEKWKKWTPDMEDIRSYGVERSKAVSYNAPKEIIDLYNSVI